MKNPESMSPAELAAVVAKSPAIASEIIKAKSKEIPRYSDGTPVSAEDSFPWDRFDGDAIFVEESMRNGSYQLALNARNVRLAREAAETARVERDAAVEKIIQDLDDRGREDLRLEDEAEYRRTRGVIETPIEKQERERAERERK